MKNIALIGLGGCVVIAGRGAFRLGFHVSGALLVGVGVLVCGHGLNELAFAGMS